MTDSASSLFSGGLTLDQQDQRKQAILASIKSRLPTLAQLSQPVLPQDDFYVPPPVPLSFASSASLSTPLPPKSEVDMGSGGGLPLIGSSPQYSPAPSPGSPIQDLITQKAEAYGIDPRVALGIAHSESGFDPKAQNKTSSAGGLYQFIDSTWHQYGEGKDKYDPVANADAGMRFIRDNQKTLERYGIDPTAGATYLALFLGPGGAVKVLSHPNELASKYLTTGAIESNGLQGKTGNDLLAWAEHRLNYVPPSVASLGGSKDAV